MKSKIQLALSLAATVAISVTTSPRVSADATVDAKPSDAFSKEFGSILNKANEPGPAQSAESSSITNAESASENTSASPDNTATSTAGPVTPAATNTAAAHHHIVDADDFSDKHLKKTATSASTSKKLPSSKRKPTETDLLLPGASTPVLGAAAAADDSALSAPAEQEVAHGPTAPLAPFTRSTPTDLPGIKNANQFIREASVQIPNMHVLSAHVIRGGQPTPENLELLHKAGIRTVINLRNEDVLVSGEGAAVQKLGMRYVTVPMNIFDVPSKQQINAFLSAVDASPGPVYVHCLHGQDRTGTMCAIYRIYKDGWDANRAFQEMISYGFRPYLASLSTAVYEYSAAAGRPVVRPPAQIMLSDFIGKMTNKVRNTVGSPTLGAPATVSTSSP